MYLYDYHNSLITPTDDQIEDTTKDAEGQENSSSQQSQEGKQDETQQQESTDSVFCYCLLLCFD